MAGNEHPVINGDGLRERKPKEHEENANEDADVPPGQKAYEKTYGRTPDGTVFVVPETHDMVSQLLSPSQPKNFSDIVVLAVLGIHILAIYLLPASLRVPIYATTFLFWRACYNVGIGYLLHLQSKHWRLVAWAKRSKVFVNPKSDDNPHPIFFHMLKREMETKIPQDYKFEDAPVEYNTWLVFRRVVDLILMCDFVSYCLFAMACGGRPLGEGMVLTLLRWLTGLGLFGFNLWVKLDAHRVVKDYAWYWGDFFYLIDQELTFDGVFEMAPHPMYSIGYTGFYGISLMAASYKVLFISIIAHVAQFAFLIWVENPHIEKTYNSPPARKQRSGTEPEFEHEQGRFTEADHVYNAPPLASANKPSPVHNLLGLSNFDFHRVTDTSIVLLQFYTFALAVFTPNTRLYQGFFVANAALWRLWYSVGVGYLLIRQSTKQRWTRHFLKYGESTEEGWRQWKGTYHIAMTMCYTSFVAASWKMYSLPPDWSYRMVLLRHVLGVGMVALQVWTNISIYDSLGEFGWFFGDFFFDHTPKLTYSGIYRFLNNPERIIGLAGVWGAAWITASRAIFSLALMSHILTLAFIQLVERPHMQKLYGQSLRRESGLVKSLKRSLPPHLWQWRGSVDKMLEGTLDSVEEFLDVAGPKISTGVSILVRDSTALFKHPTRISITRLAPDLAGFDPKDYSLNLEGSPLTIPMTSKNGEGHSARAEQRSDFKTLILEYGAPIKVQWTAPLNHSKKDWIGLYMIADNASRAATRVSSQGRWVATNADHYGSIVADRGILMQDVQVSGDLRKDGESKDFLSGEVEFAGDKLWWTTGVFEFRYHHNGKHNVMAISLPFETRINKFDEEDVDADTNGSVQNAVGEALLHCVRNCFDRDPDIAPSTVEESFGGQVERDGKFARRVVYAVHQMFGIEFAPEVVQADGTVRNLAWRVCNAKKVLKPYMSLSRSGKSTPTESQF
ncbi:phosphatidylethanolamine N-methyltransferase [Lecanora helva]